MKKVKRIIDLVEAEKGGYYKVAIRTADGMHGTATIPDKGRVAVYKEKLEWPPSQTSFAWKIRQTVERSAS